MLSNSNCSDGAFNDGAKVSPAGQLSARSKLLFEFFKQPDGQLGNNNMTGELRLPEFQVVAAVVADQPAPYDVEALEKEAVEARKKNDQAGAEARLQLTKKILGYGKDEKDQAKLFQLLNVLTIMYGGPQTIPLDKSVQLRLLGLLKTDQPSDKDFARALDRINDLEKKGPPKGDRDPGLGELAPAQSKDDVKNNIQAALNIPVDQEHPEKSAAARQQQLNAAAEFYAKVEPGAVALVARFEDYMYRHLRNPIDANDNSELKRYLAAVDGNDPYKITSLSSERSAAAFELLRCAQMQDNEERLKALAEFKNTDHYKKDPTVQAAINEFEVACQDGRFTGGVVEDFIWGKSIPLLLGNRSVDPKKTESWYQWATGMVTEHPVIAGVSAISALAAGIGLYKIGPFRTIKGLGWAGGYAVGWTRDMAYKFAEGFTEGKASEKGRPKWTKPAGPTNPLNREGMRPGETYEEYIRRQAERTDVPKYEQNPDGPNVRPSPEAMREAAQADMNKVFEHARRLSGDIPNARDVLSNNQAATRQLLQEAREAAERELGRPLNSGADAQLRTFMESGGAGGRLINDITVPSGSGQRAPMEPVRTSNTTSVNDLQQRSVEIDPASRTVKSEVRVFGNRNPLDEPEFTDQVKNHLDKRVQTLRAIKEPTEKEKAELAHLEKTRPQWSSADPLVRSGFLRGEIEAGRMEVKVGEGRGGSGTVGTLTGLGIVITAIGLWVLPDRKAQGRPGTPIYR
jgi:hypothetical protein